VRERRCGVKGIEERDISGEVSVLTSRRGEKKGGRNKDRLDK
jgi:hypothetical protein